VTFNGSQSAAGNYLVIDGDGTGDDTAYMHLRDAALPAKGDRVQTGEVVGYVGDTGDANGCHLHFELWTAPGWYTGGHLISGAGRGDLSVGHRAGGARQIPGATPTRSSRAACS
jgi:murein DD-endopeptidase MepM/ murein hydrolase activator NlpD